jgi:hypothetical protein
LIVNALILALANFKDYFSGGVVLFRIVESSVEKHIPPPHPRAVSFSVEKLGFLGAGGRGEGRKKRF